MPSMPRCRRTRLSREWARVPCFVVIRWKFEIQDKQGKTVRFEELSHQRWEGNLMAEEQFFYDPAQLK